MNFKKSKTSDESPDMGSNTVPEHMIDPKSENWTKNANIYDISNEISIPKHGSAYENRFIGPNIKTYTLLYTYTGMKPGPEYDRYASPLSSEQFKDLEPSMPYRKSIEIPNSNLDDSRSCSEDKSKDYMKPENRFLDASKGLVNLQVAIPPSYEFQGYFWGTSFQNMVRSLEKMILQAPNVKNLVRINI